MDKSHGREVFGDLLLYFHINPDSEEPWKEKAAQKRNGFNYTSHVGSERRLMEENC